MTNGAIDKIIEKRASMGEPNAAHILGVHYYGLHTSQSKQLALSNLIVSVRQYPWDNYYVGSIRIVDGNRKEAMQFLESSSDCPLSLYRLSIEYINTNPPHRYNSVRSLFRLENVMSELENRPNDEKTVYKEWLLEAANTSDPYASYLVGRWYAEGILFDQSYPEALYYLQKSSDLGYSVASGYLSDMYFDGLGVRASEDKSLEYLIKAARSDPWYMNKLGDWYMSEYNDCKNSVCPTVGLDSVIDTYSKATGIPDASFKLGLIYLSENVVFDEKLAFDKILEAAVKGQPNAVMELSYLLSNGIGVEKSSKLAAEVENSIYCKYNNISEPNQNIGDAGYGYVYERCPGITNSSDGRYHIEWHTVINYLYVYSDPTFVFRSDSFD